MKGGTSASETRWMLLVLTFDVIVWHYFFSHFRHIFLLTCWRKIYMSITLWLFRADLGSRVPVSCLLWFDVSKFYIKSEPFFGVLKFIIDTCCCKLSFKTKCKHLKSGCHIPAEIWNHAWRGGGLPALSLISGGETLGLHYRKGNLRIKPPMCRCSRIVRKQANALSLWDCWF